MNNFESNDRPSIRLHREAAQSTESTHRQLERPTDGRQRSRQDRELDRIAGVSNPKTVTLPVAKIVPLLIHAVESNRTWLHDFADDTVRIDADLYEVLLAYQQIIDRKAA